MHSMSTSSAAAASLRHDNLEQVGPLGSFMRHTTSMASPNIPRYAQTGHWPPCRITGLHTTSTIDNAFAHQRYLEMLNFESHLLHQWSSMIAEPKRLLLKGTSSPEISHHVGRPCSAASGEYVDKSAICTTDDTETYGFTSTSSADGFNADADAATWPNIASEAAPTPRTSGSQPSSSSTPPANQPFLPQQGADPWMKGGTTCTNRCYLPNNYEARRRFWSSKKGRMHETSPTWSKRYIVGNMVHYFPCVSLPSAHKGSKGGVLGIDTNT